MIGVPKCSDYVVEIEPIAIAMRNAGVGVDTKTVVAIDVLDGLAV